MSARWSARWYALAAVALSLPALVSLARVARAGNCVPVPPALVGWWKLEGNGNDETGLHNGAPTGSGSFVAGEVGLGYRSNAAGNAVVVPHDAGLNVTNLTLDAWVHPELWPYYNCIAVWKGNSTGTDFTTPFALGILGTNRGADVGKPFFFISNGLAQDQVFAPAPIPLGAWSHLAASANGTTITLYVNGVPVASAPQTMTPQFNTQPLVIGACVGTGALNYVAGTVDEVELHSAPVPDSQIYDIYAAGSAGKCPLATPAVRTSWGQVRVLYR